MSYVKIAVGVAAVAGIAYAGYKLYQVATEMVDEEEKKAAAAPEAEVETPEWRFFSMIRDEFPDIQFNEKWAGDTGYFEKIEQDETLQPGKYRCKDLSGREMVILVTSDKGIVVYNRRYTDKYTIVAQSYGTARGTIVEGVQDMEGIRVLRRLTM